MTETMNVVLWVRRMIEKLGIPQSSVSVFCNKQSAIHLYKNHAYHEKAKHIKMMMYWI